MQTEKNDIQLGFSTDHFHINKNNDSGSFSDRLLYYSAAQRKFLFSLYQETNYINPSY